MADLLRQPSADRDVLESGGRRSGRRDGEQPGSPGTPRLSWRDALGSTRRGRRTDRRSENRPGPGRPRRRAVLIIFTVAFVVTAGVALERMAPGDGSSTGAPSSSAPTADGAASAPHDTSSTGAAPVVPPPADPNGPQAIAVRFADARHGYALTGACRGGNQGPCHYWFYVTTDAGRHWQPRKVPLGPPAPPDGYSADLVVLGPASVLVEERGARWFSGDTGRSWRRVSAGAVGGIATVPAGWRIIGTCPYAYETTAGCAEPVSALDPRTGALWTLLSPPPLAAVLGTEPPPSPRDGSLWVAGTDPGTGKPAIAVSRDRGRTWHTERLDVAGGNVFGISLLTRDGRTAFAFIRGQVRSEPQVKNGLVAIWRSADGGQSWHRVEPRRGGAQPRSALGVALLPDGRLMVTTETFDATNLWYSTDGGREFRKIGESGPMLGWIEEADGRYVAGGVSGGYSTSTNGVDWTPLSPG